MKFTPAFWNERWIDAQRLSRTSGHGRECWQAWDDYESAKNYAENSKKGTLHSTRVSYLASLCDSSSWVLDIGSGPGSLAIPLSAKVSHVHAVEPAHGMRVVFEEQLISQKIKNISIIPRRWDDVSFSELNKGYDLVFCSFAFGMLDIFESIKKMIKCSNKILVLFWHAGDQAWDADAKILWPLLHDKKFSPIPKSDILFNLLYSMEIYPDIEVLPKRQGVAFTSLEEAMKEYQKRFNVLDNDSLSKAKLKDYLESSLIKKDGMFFQKNTSSGMRFTIPRDRVPPQWL